MKSAKTKAQDIPQRVKEAVRARDGGRCLLCGHPGEPNAHFISRARDGLGIEENIVSLCWPCHCKYDEGTDQERKRAEFLLRAYLEWKYPGFPDRDRKYDKWRGIFG